MFTDGRGSKNGGARAAAAKIIAELNTMELFAGNLSIETVQKEFGKAKTQAANVKGGQHLNKSMQGRAEIYRDISKAAEEASNRASKKVAKERANARVDQSLEHMGAKGKRAQTQQSGPLRPGRRQPGGGGKQGDIDDDEWHEICPENDGDEEDRLPKKRRSTLHIIEGLRAHDDMMLQMGKDIAGGAAQFTYSGQVRHAIEKARYAPPNSRVCACRTVTRQCKQSRRPSQGPMPKCRPQTTRKRPKSVRNSIDWKRH
jgi:hypothetical protein